MKKNLIIDGEKILSNLRIRKLCIRKILFLQ